jgi:hypothetical protein
MYGGLFGSGHLKPDVDIFTNDGSAGCVPGPLGIKRLHFVLFGNSLAVKK